MELDGATRLISRNRFRLPTLAARIGMLPMAAGSLVMERKMLRGIKERAEHRTRVTMAQPALALATEDMAAVDLYCCPWCWGTS